MHTSTSRAKARRADGWIVGPPSPTAPAVRLFCLPYVGGAASVYEPWRGALGGDVEVCPVELPGHQTRLRERALTRIDELVDALASALADELDVPYALFGHSLGSLVAFELARELRRRGAGEPRALFVSGGPAPRLPRTHPPVHEASEAEVVARLRMLGGLPDEVLAEPELLGRFLPTIRADFAVFETYAFTPERPLTCPVVAFTGSEDTDVPLDRVEPWSAESTGRFEHHVLPGGHFFVHTARTALLNLVRGELTGPASHHDQDSRRTVDQQAPFRR
ncbi:thioesterase domain-containing protein [Umezawaea sp. Da 62-37]|uniref:thioesterase II family protein n=1 Tax=Umezawaea sp. Da 62-37 TaxID=3075927 RepID=UPI0028F747C7|nr:thioesterase domain-containing protein [Umezawaea sp. Da 62-37]WNV87572.1 alpha/beta fold hydrolase [Umezawaea sp. Da 62-37]